MPDELVVRMVMDRLAQPDASGGFILDGFPRTVPQAEALEAALDQAEQPLSAVLKFAISDDMAVRRLSNRWTLPGLQAHLQHGVQAAGQRSASATSTAAELERRADDDELTVRRRLALYRGADGAARGVLP